MNKKVFLLSYADGGLLGMYSTARKAVTAAATTIEAHGWTYSGPQAAICVKMLKSGELSCRLVALEAADPYDQSKTLVIDRWRVQ